MRHPAPLRQAGPVEIAIHVIDQAVKELLIQRKELVAQLPERRRRTRKAFLWDPSTHTRIRIQKEEDAP